MNSEKTVTACLIVIGNEILSGRTQDANVQYLAKGLNEEGVRLGEVRVIPDIVGMIVKTVNECRQAFDYVFTTGGIGPTHDDITADSIAKAFGVSIDSRPDAVALLTAYSPDRELTEARLRMTRIPDGGVLVKNPVSGAPGFRLENVYVLAGVPMVMQAMFDGIKHELVGSQPMVSRSVSVTLGESVIAAGLAALQERYPDIDIGSYPAMRQRQFGVSVVLRGPDPARLDQAVAELKTVLRDLGGEPVEEEAG